MVSSRLLVALAGLAVSAFVSVAAWLLFDTLLLFLFVPFVPLLLRRVGSAGSERTPRECPACGFRTADPSYAFCPRDGTRLE